jgi:hypothetical protein
MATPHMMAVQQLRNKVAMGATSEADKISFLKACATSSLKDSDNTTES